ncbi:MAG TPA: amidohydrolase [Alphaproteobacteria bacterium]|nr:amidohydrolase [Alphaproteobacteria bacterium]HAJ45437.1 amidohydrolase [Alphaproteobacteria bacterium]
MSETWTIAAAQYPLHRVRDFKAYAEHIHTWVEEGARRAQLLVFPEYASVEIGGMIEGPEGLNSKNLLRVIARWRPELDELHAQLSRRFGVYILAGSCPSVDHAGVVRNAARLFAPSGAMGVQDKLMMTRFEDEEAGVSPGRGPQVFDTSLGRIGIATCFDIEFPLITRAMVEAGAEVILAPSCTEALHGYWRVRVGAQARALENQCYVVQSPLLGRASWLHGFEQNTGAAGVFAPPDGEFPADGVVALGAMNAPGWTYAEIKFDALARVRHEGAVFNYKHWGLQPGATPLPAVLQPLD